MAINKKEKERIYQVHDKSIRKILLNKKEAVIFINQALRLENTKNEIKEEEIELYNNQYVTKIYNNRISDIVYKIKNKNVYFLIEHQLRIDYSMALRIAEYIVAILGIGSQKRKNKNMIIPLVIPIVLYTGEKEWDAKECITDLEERLDGYGNKEFGRYILFSINKDRKKEVVQMKGILSKIILLDSSKNEEELKENYKIIKKYNMNKSERELLNEYTYNVLSKILNKNDIEELNNELLKERGGKSMVLELLLEAKKKADVAEKKADLIERRAEKKVYEKEKKLEKTIKQIVEEMLRNNINVETIKKCTKLSTEEIMKLKKSI